MRSQVFGFDDHLSFFKAQLRATRSSTHPRPVSLPRLAKRLGYRSKRSLGMMLDGTRLPSSRMVERISRYLKLSAEEHRYLELLVRRARERAAESPPKLPTPSWRLIMSITRNRFFFEAKTLVASPVGIIFRCFYLVARPDFKESPSDIRKKLRGKVSLLEAGEALKTLERAGILKRDEHGRLCQAVDSIAAGGRFPARLSATITDR